MGGKTSKRRMSADDTRSGRPSSLTCVGVRKEYTVYQRIRDNRRYAFIKNESEVTATHTSAIILFQTK